MASLQLTIIIIAVLLSSFWFPTATAVDFPDESVPDFTASSPTPTATSSPYDIHDSFAPTSIFEPILSNLGFQELSMAVPSLSDDSAFTTWNGPTTIFAPTDASLKSCGSCSVVHLLREHIVPGLFSHEYLRKLAFGTKIETMDPGRCITVTSSTDANNDNYTKIYIGGVEITRPDLFNNGLIVVHGLQGYVAPLSPFSCNVERMTSLSFPVQTDNHNNNDETNNRQNAVVQQSLHHPIYIMRLMLRDAMLRLRNSGYSILALAMKMKSVELMSLHNMTVFALDDVSIFTGSHNYVNNVRFHIVPNMLLAISDLEKIKSGTLLPTLESGQSLMVTTTSGGFTPMRINYVRIKVPDVMRNLKIVVHSIYLPFPHLHPSAVTYEEDTSAGVPHFELKNMDKDQVKVKVNGSGKCTATDEAAGSCDVVKPVVMRAEHQGL
uniref:fasciclin-like arabinogalactan protein 21 n=1 Tax=Erigeron canadensis TaxID=72917 RepID=UPI001CB99915|nr:fasciclin-like arabinogalactan protein 21 [Erigeron canadensis]